MPYIRDSFWRGREFASVTQMQADAERWCTEVAGQRACLPLDGAAPAAVFAAAEKDHLRPLPPSPFVLAEWSRTKVGPLDIHVFSELGHFGHSARMAAYWLTGVVAVRIAGMRGCRGRWCWRRVLLVSIWASLSSAPARLTLQSFDFAEPAFVFGFGDAGDEVVADLGEPARWAGSGQSMRAADAGVLVDAWGAERAAAGADGNLAPLEVAEELLPFLVGGDAGIPRLGRSARRRARNARWAGMASSG